MISQYVDDELSPEKKRDFDTHTDSCSYCRKALEETWTLHGLFASAERSPAPYGFVTRVLANLEGKEELRLRSRLFIRPYLRWAVQVALALVVMTFGIISGNQFLAHRTEPVEQTAIEETFSLDLFQATPPHSIGGIYVTLMRSRHEK